MRLDELLKDVENARVLGDPSVEILDLAYDSRKVQPGSLFFALPGQHVDGTQFVEEAVRRGASAVVLPTGNPIDPGMVAAEVDDVRGAMALMAARFFGDPSRELVLVGVTGTNGKTTFTYLMESILKHAGFRPGVVGTISYRYGEHVSKPVNTTPESVDLQRLLRDMLGDGCTHVLLEVSSEGLDSRRVDACHFSCGVFTNLGRDHLDHHGDMKAYFASKARLFTKIMPQSAVREPMAVLNGDDPYGSLLKEKCQGPVCMAGRNHEADCCLEAVSFGRSGISLEVRTTGGRLSLKSPLLSEVNALNILMAVAVADQMGLPTEAIDQGIQAVKRVPGRLEVLPGPEDFLVLVDYAHTPDAMDKVLRGLREMTPGRLITVFGCGGDRDRGKRPLMGASGARWSDLVLVTSDNPRSEPSEGIIKEIIQGIEAAGMHYRRPKDISRVRQGTKAYTWLVDRGDAIRVAIRAAVKGDTVLIAGKGHEDVQIIGEKRIPFRDDQEVIRVLRSSDNKESALA